MHEEQRNSTDIEKDISSFYSVLLASQEQLGEDFEKVLYDNLWDMYVHT